MTAEQGERFCALFARRYRWMAGRGMLDLDDLMQVARIGLEDAKANFVGEQGSNFRAYAGMVIRQRMTRAMSGMHPVHVPEKVLRKEWRALDRSGAARRDQWLEDESELWGVAPANDDGAELNFERVASAVALLPERQQRVLRLRFFRDMSLREIAADMGFSPERARQLELRALDTLRSALKAA